MDRIEKRIMISALMIYLEANQQTGRNEHAGEAKKLLNRLVGELYPDEDMLDWAEMAGDVLQ